MASEWHPILAAVEGPTGTWRMVDPDGREYGRIEIRRVMNGTDVRYRCERHGEVVGWATTLREAATRLHMAYLASLRSCNSRSSRPSSTARASAAADNRHRRVAGLLPHPPVRAAPPLAAFDRGLGLGYPRPWGG